MGQAVASGATITCTFGTTPSTLTVPPSGRVDADKAPMAVIADSKPNANIAPFGMCSSLANPQVAAATSAAQGVLTPQPCVPMTMAPWTPGSVRVTIGGQPALSAASQCTCTWGGVITVGNPGTRTTQVP